ncbi:MAG: hypothetical protein V3V67_19290 [Myxococcota bacterium]
MSEEATTRAPVSGTCGSCGCALGYRASQRDESWYCCGACAGSDRCICGCKAEYAREDPTDAYVPTRRMFAARHPDGLKTREDAEDRQRAFPFADRRRGR